MNRPSNPEIVVCGASDEETAAVVAAVGQFIRDATPAGASATIEPAVNPWKRAALLEGISRQPDQ